MINYMEGKVSPTENWLVLLKIIKMSNGKKKTSQPLDKCWIAFRELRHESQSTMSKVKV